MQVFEVFAYNLNHIKFKDNKDFFDAMLKELDLVYSDIAFCFHSDSQGSICDKAIKFFPALKEYKQYLDASERWAGSPPEYRLCSVRTDCSGRVFHYVQKDHIEAFCGLLKKIPQSINFGFMGIVLDNVDWYAEETHKPTFCSPKERNKVYDHNFSGYFSNSIRFFKEYDYGNKINSVEIMIKRTEKDGALEPYPVAFSKMLAILGKPKYQFLKCQFDGDEEEKWIKAAQKIDEIIVQSKKDVADLGTSPDAKGFLLDTDSLLDSVTPIAGFFPKSIFGKEAKKKGYRYQSFSNGCYKYAKCNGNNHTFTVEIMNIPFSSFWEVSFSVKGYNYSHTLYCAKQLTIKSLAYAQKCAQWTFETALKLERQYTELLLNAYGKTPEWFVNSMD